MYIQYKKVAYIALAWLIISLAVVSPASAYLNLTNFTETDPGGKITVTANRISVVSELGASSKVNTTFTNMSNFNTTFEMNVTQATLDGGWHVLLGDSFTNPSWNTWGTNNGVGMTFIASAPFGYVVPEKYVAGTRSVGSSISISSGVTYYVNLARNGTVLELSVFSDSTFTTHVSGSPQSLSVVSTNFTQFGVFNDIQYIQARSYNITNISFTTTRIPILTNPTTNSVDYETEELDINWTVSTNASSYYYQLANDSAFADLMYNVKVTNNYSGRVSIPTDQQLFFRVRANDGIDNSSWSPVVSIRDLSLSYPVSGSTIYTVYPPILTTIDFTWSAASSSVVYFNLLVSKDENFNVIEHDTTAAGTTRSVSLASGKHYYKVRPYFTATGTYGSYTQPWNFTLVVNASNQSGKAGIQGVVYEMISGVQTPISGANVYISNSTSTVSYSTTTGSNGYYLFDNLTNGTTYYINAKAQGYNDGAIEYVTTGNGVWSTKDILLTKCISGQDCFGTQNYIKFIATDFFGNLYQSISVSVYKGSDITTTYTGTTGTDGAITFLLTKDQSYRLVFSSSTITTTTITITPGETTLFYVFVSSAAPPPFWENTSYQEVDTVRTAVTTAVIGTNAFVNVTYNDSLSQTTAWTIFLNQTNHTNASAPQITIQSSTGSGNATVSFMLTSGFQGENYLVNIKATHTTFGSILRSYGVQFYGTKDGSLDYIPDAIMAVIAIMILIFVGSFFDSTNYAQGAGIICVIGWIELGLGMFAYADMYISVGVGLGIASVIAIIANMNERNRRETMG